MASFPSAHSPAKWKLWHSRSTAFEPQIPEACRRCLVFFFWGIQCSFLYSQACVADGWKTWTWSSVVTDTCQSKAEMQSVCMQLLAGVQLCWPLAGLVCLVCSDGSSQGRKRKEESLSSQLETGCRQGESLSVLISTTGFASWLEKSEQILFWFIGTSWKLCGIILQILKKWLVRVFF